MFLFSRSKSAGRSLAPRGFRLRLEPLEDRQMLSITVNSIDDYAQVASPSFPGETGHYLADMVTPLITLRSAVEAVNSGADDEMLFSLSAPYTIAPSSPLPAITHDDVTIDGAGLVTLDGTSAGAGASGLTLHHASDCTIQGLTIRNFTAHGIVIEGAGADSLLFDFASDDDPLAAGSVNVAQGNHVIGNQLLGNAGDGLLISHASLNEVRDNTIGGNHLNGIEIYGSGGAVITTFVPARNTADNVNETAAIENDAIGNFLLHNYIGVTVGDADAGNWLDGVLIDGACLTTVGDAENDGGNVIANNGGDGVRITGQTDVRPEMTISTEAPLPAASAAAAAAAGSSFPAAAALAATLEAFARQIAATASSGSAASPAPSPTASPASPVGKWYAVNFTNRVPVLNAIAGNLIGTNTAGDAVAGNAHSGVHVEAAARVTFITQNVIGGNAENGVLIEGNPLNQHAIDDSAAIAAGGYYGHHIPDHETDPVETFDIAGQAFEDNDPLVEFFPTLVESNQIGLHALAGETHTVAALPNGGDGVWVRNSRAFIQSNTISANVENGVHVQGSPTLSYAVQHDADHPDRFQITANTLVCGNYIGANPDGTVDENSGNHGDGVLLDGDAEHGGGAQHNYVGGLGNDGIVGPTRNVISGNAGWGVHVAGIGVFHVEGPYTYGTKFGYVDPFLYPVVKDALGAIVQGNLRQPYGTYQNAIANNYIGTDATGLAAGGNAEGGILVDNAASFTLIGDFSSHLGERPFGNVIAGNGPASASGTTGAPGVKITGRGTAVNELWANLIGLDASGQAALPNHGPGVEISDGASSNNVGGDAGNADLMSRNYIAGNDGPGIYIHDVYDLRRAIVNPAPGQTVGDPGRDFFDGSGNPDESIWNREEAQGANYWGNALVSNWIGLGRGTFVEDDEIGNPIYKPLAIGNRGDGILIENASDQYVGGMNPGWSKNFIAANDGHGIQITGANSWLNLVQQNVVGVAPLGFDALRTLDPLERPFANGGDGLLITDEANHNVVQGQGYGKVYVMAQLGPSAIFGGNGDVFFDIQSHVFDLAPNGNVFANNGANGVEIAGAAHHNLIAGGNYIGTDVAGTAELGNAASGILITGGALFNYVVPGLRVNYYDKAGDHSGYDPPAENPADVSDDPDAPTRFTWVFD